MESLIQRAVLWAVPLVTAVVLHEVAHGWAAAHLGDDTASRSGRLTLNPLAHADLFGTVVLPLLLLVSGAPFLFGYAKPVPINPANFRRPRRDFALVALAGPAMNLLLAALCGLALHALRGPAAGGGALGVLALIAAYGVLMNVVLATFNLLPIPPLDGGRVAMGLLPLGPARGLARLEPFGMLILVVLIMSGAVGRLLGPVTHGLLRLFLPA
jgi:Zn-dependent protease